MAGPLMGRGGGHRRYKAMSEINVTPFVDVMLVLLIIFMVAAPMMTSGVPVDLPRTNATPLAQEQEPITISVNPEGRIFIQETEVPMEELVTRLRAIAEAQPTPAGEPQRRIFVRGDRAITYGRVMEVMGNIASGGFTRVALLAEQPPGRAAPATSAPPAPAPPAPAVGGPRNPGTPRPNQPR